MSGFKINDFKYPASDKISGRTSTICRSMACTLLKREGCSTEVEEIWKKYFPNKTCAYCGKPANHLDHLYPLIIDRKPTGYGTDPGNLVPCCTACNQPKGNLNWEDYMRSTLCKHVCDEMENDVEVSKEKRISTIKEFQVELPAEKVIISDDILLKWEEILHSFDKALQNANDDLIDLKTKLYGDI